MKKSYSYLALCVWFLLGMNINEISAQFYVDVSINHICIEDELGSIDLIFDSSIENDYPFPYDAEWENIDDGDYAQFEINSLNYQIGGLTPGEYEITINLGDECIIFLVEELFSSSDLLLTADIFPIGNELQCESGSIDLHISNGIPPYDIHWLGPNDFDYLVENLNGDNSGEDIVDLVASSYSVTITDDIGCSLESSYEIESNYDPDFEIQINSIGCVCPGGGNIEVSVLGNSGPYIYQWTGEENFSSQEEDVSVFLPGIYDIEVFNSNGCSVSQTLNISLCEFNFENFETNITNSCQGPNSGAIEVQVDDLSMGPFNFIWENSEGETIPSSEASDGNSVISGLEAGSYCLTIQTSNGCIASSCDLVVEYFEPIEVSYEIIPISEDGADDGEIDLTVIGGGEVEFQWNTGGTSEDLFNLGEGTYIVEVIFEDGNCSQTLEFELSLCDDLGYAIAVEADVTPMSINLNDGAIDLNVLNVDGYSLNFDWEGINTGFSSSMEDISGLSPDTYCVKITSANCSETLETLCFEICNTAFGFTYADFENCDYIEVFAKVVGEAPYTYTWSDGSTNLMTQVYYGQEYCVTITGQNNCSFSDCIVINPPDLELEFNITNATFGSSNGVVKALSEGSSPFTPYTYQWDNGGTGSLITGLTPNNYCVTVTDDCGETISDCALVECEITSNMVSSSITNVSCGENPELGSININVALDDAPNANSFTWSNGETSNYIEDLVAGEYCVTIVNNPSTCVYTNCYTVDSEGEGNFTLSFDANPTCSPTGGGSISVAVNGGVGPFTYYWTDGSIKPLDSPYSNMIDDVPFGWYEVEVTDANGCTVSDYIFLPSTGNTFEYEVEVTGQDACAGTADASVINLSDGVEPFTYSWSNCFPCNEMQEQGPSVQGLTPGLYIVEVTDAMGCVNEQAFYIYSTEMTIVEEVNTECCTYCSSISVEVYGAGSPPFDFEWSNGESTPLIENLTPGDYTLTVTSSSGCSVEETYTIEDLDNPFVIYSTTNINSPICPNSSDGFIELSITNTQPGFNIEWSHGPTTESVYGLSAGEYSVTLTGSEGCENITNFEIEQTITEVIVTSLTNPITDNSTEGAIDIEVIGVDGASPYTYLWSNGATTQDISYLGIGTYTVTVTDAFGCTATMDPNLIPCKIVQNIFSPLNVETIVQPFDQPDYADYGYGNIGAIEVVVSGGIPPVYIELIGDDPSIHLNETLYNNGSIVFSGLGVGDYSINVTDGCETIETWRPIRTCESNPIFPLNIRGNVTPICPLGGEGSISILLSGAGGLVSPYAFEWINLENPNNIISTDQNLTGITQAGVYCVKMTTWAGCVEEECFQVEKTYEASQHFWSDWSCSYYYYCPQSSSPGFTYGEPLEVTIEVLEGGACVGYPVCPIDQLEGTQIYGQQVYIGNPQPFNETQCYVPVGCKLTLGNVDRTFATGFDDIIDCETEIEVEEVYEEEEEEGEEDGCDENSIYEVDLDSGCDIKVYCLVQGVTTFLYDEDSDAVLLCQDYYGLNDGNCRVRSWCPFDCGFEVLAGNTNTTIPDAECSDPDYSYLPTCDYLESLNLCDGFIGNDNDDVFFMTQDPNGTYAAGWMKADELDDINTENTQEVFLIEPKVYPNPFKNDVNVDLRLFKDDLITVEVFDVLGQRIQYQEFEGSKGANTFNVPFNFNINDGVYNMKISGQKRGISYHKILHLK